MLLSRALCLEMSLRCLEPVLQSHLSGLSRLLSAVMKPITLTKCTKVGIHFRALVSITFTTFSNHNIKRLTLTRSVAFFLQPNSNDLNYFVELYIYLLIDISTSSVVNLVTNKILGTACTCK